MRRAGSIVAALAAPAALLTLPVVAQNGPRLQFQVTRRDLGAVKAGEPVRLSFPLRNTGRAPLQIFSVEGDCGCVVPTFPRTVAPGASAAIEARFEPEATWSGHVEKNLRVKSNDASQPEIPLGVAANVIPYVKMDPASPLQLLFHRGKSYTKEIRLTPRAGSTLGLSNPQCTSPNVKAVLEPPAEGDKSRTYRLKLEIGPMKEPGDFSATVRVATTERRLPESWFVVAGLALEGPVVNPREVLLPMVRPVPGQEVTRLQIFTRSGTLKVLGIETGSPALKAELIPRNPGHFYEVSLRPNGVWKPGPFKTTLRVRTDDRTNPVIPVPFLATVP